MSMQGKTVFITGASKGIGRGIATEFAKHGANVAIVARDKQAAKSVADELVSNGYQAIGLSADVADKASLESAVNEAVSIYGRVDILCANAGIFPSAGLEEMTEADWDIVMNTNLKGTLFSVQACLPELKKSAAGRIVITSSITGPITGFPGWSHYGASKAGQLGFIRTAAIELAKYGITVNAVMPGNILTEGLAGMGDEYLAQTAASIPLKRLGSVEDIANAMLYFASEQAGYVTGQTIVVDGGQVLPESMEAVG
ncbi:3-oxoacyl-ACP reductase FabG [Thiomicrorhabdus heinhorstiae]|uniref:3-oxoacyl-ACP reductase FabG n=1 Tax=Thiomicrorhabdus heinhorstiae TaxID=2748010 RepID=A0ABS0BVI3_9GAMM|nr:3-oxoacyl-ACP reductase FabG [Thiomicrorhabdus heinhorstiae]MBF6057840.1 3-oxoacyl-ACP reductase FabG [Thiomicrorhabdus heinhorstiae]